MLKHVPGIQGVYDEVVRRKLRSLEYVLINLITQEMCNEAVE